MVATVLKAEIFSQGEEVVAGEIADTNAAWLSSKLVDLGVDVVRHTAVGDRLADLVIAMQEINGRADVCLCTGGLGPTCDDLTAEAAAEAFHSPLLLDEVALGQIHEYYRARQRAMPDINRKQAMLPQMACRIDNRWGTAPGFRLQAGRCRFFFLPGVPSEMRAMYLHFVEPILKSDFILSPRRCSVLRTFGQGESQLQEILDGLSLPDQVRLGFRVNMPYVDVKLQFAADFRAGEREAIERVVRERLGDCVSMQLRSDEGGLALGLVDVLEPMMRGFSLAVVESVSGGELARQAAGRRWFLESTVVPDVGRLRRKFVARETGMDENTSRQTWLMDLALAFRAQGQADIVLVQCPGEAPSEPVGMALVGPGFSIYRERIISGEVIRQQRTAAAWALDQLRRQLSGLA